MHIGEKKLLNTLLITSQWAAMVVTLIASWLVGSCSSRKRSLGFWCFILSNTLWVIWGWYDNALALVGLQIGLFILNLRGAQKNEHGSAKNHDSK